MEQWSHMRNRGVGGLRRAARWHAARAVSHVGHGFLPIGARVGGDQLRVGGCVCVLLHSSEWHHAQ